MASKPRKIVATAADQDQSPRQPSGVESRVMPLVALRETVIFPEMIVPLQVGREKSVKALDHAVADLRLAYDERPVTLIATIYRIADRKIQSFSDSFRLRDD